MHDFLGDAYRAQGKFDDARAEYTRAHELDPDNALPLQQRGHVNSFLGNYAEARADYDSAIVRGRANEKADYGTYRAFVSIHEGNPQAAIDELKQLVTKIDQLDIPEPRGLKINALSNAATIATHTGMFDEAETLLRQRSQLMMEQADAVGTEEFRRSQQADITYFDAWLAAKKGDYQTAQSLTNRMAELVEPDNNPRKMEPVHELQGLIALYQGKHSEATTQLEQGNTDNMYIRYSLAQAHEGAGDTEKAKELYRDVADNNFNSVDVALLRKDATQKAG
jgi:tetratricopeptide (TPR) repeat protein